MAERGRPLVILSSDSVGGDSVGGDSGAHASMIRVHISVCALPNGDYHGWTRTTLVVTESTLPRGCRCTPCVFVCEFALAILVVVRLDWECADRG